MIQYLLFDLDGVLVDARELHYESLNRALDRFGYTITREEHLSTYDGLPTTKKLKLLTEKKGLHPDLYDEIWSQKQKETRTIIDRSFTYDERMRGILQKLREDGLRIIVCSMSIRESTKMMLLRKGFLEYVDYYLSNEDVVHYKPNPEIFLRAMIMSGASPKECLVIEDSHHGRAAAIASGAYVCGVKDSRDVTYEKIREAIDRYGQDHIKYTVHPKWQGDNLTIIVPMAGEGKSYQRAGFTFPKPLVDIRGKPMIQWVVENINAEARFVFIVMKEHYEQYSLKYLFQLIAPHCETVLLEKRTQGALISVLKAEQFMNTDNPIVIANSDQLLEWNSNEFFYAMAADECDGGLVTFESSHPKWSYVTFDDDGFVTQAAEKIPISNHATAGIYYFRKGSEFIRYAKQMVKRKIMTHGEYYVCPVYNEYIKEKKRIRAFPIDKLWSFSTPEDLQLFNEQYTNGVSAIVPSQRRHEVRVPV